MRTRHVTDSEGERQQQQHHQAVVHETEGEQEQESVSEEKVVRGDDNANKDVTSVKPVGNGVDSKQDLTHSPTPPYLPPVDRNPSPPSATAAAFLKAFPWRRKGPGAVHLGDMGDQEQEEAATGNNNPWKRAAVRAVQIQESRKTTDNNHVPKTQTGNGGLVGSEGQVIPSSSIQPAPVTVITHHHQTAPPPPGPWSEETTSVLRLECGTAPDVQSSLLVDLGKVVGVLRTQVPETHDDDEDDDQNDIDGNQQDMYAPRINHDSDSQGLVAGPPGPPVVGCASCLATSKSDEALDDSLCGDPLMYATFVAPVQQYSTETEPSRQPSFNYPSRQPSFKQNSSENEGAAEQSYAPFPSLPVPSSLEHNYTDEVQDIYEKVPLDPWPLPPVPPHKEQPPPPLAEEENDCVEISQEELDSQVAQERLSFISGSSNNVSNDDDDPNSFPPLPPLPPTPPPKPNNLLHQASRNCNQASSPLVHDASLDHWGSGEESDNAATDRVGTVKRKNKRERNRTTTVIENYDVPCQQHQRSKSRSKSRSPGREIDRQTAQTSTSAAAIVIVHHHMSSRACSHTASSRGASPDDISESSISFHENELRHRKPEPPSSSSSVNPAKQQVIPNNNPRVPRVCEHPRDGDVPFMALFANRDSVRESWISSGSDYQGSVASTGSQQGEGIAHPFSANVPATECSVPNTPHHQRPPSGQYRPSVTTTYSLPRRSSSSSHGRGSKVHHQHSRPLRSSSRESGSSSSVRVSRGGGSSLALQKLPSSSIIGTPEGRNRLNAHLFTAIFMFA